MDLLNSRYKDRGIPRLKAAKEIPLDDDNKAYEYLKNKDRFGIAKLFILMHLFQAKAPQRTQDILASLSILGIKNKRGVRLHLQQLREAKLVNYDEKARSYTYSRKLRPDEYLIAIHEKLYLSYKTSEWFIKKLYFLDKLHEIESFTEKYIAAYQAYTIARNRDLDKSISIIKTMPARKRDFVYGGLIARQLIDAYIALVKTGSIKKFEENRQKCINDLNKYMEYAHRYINDKKAPVSQRRVVSFVLKYVVDNSAELEFVEAE